MDSRAYLLQLKAAAAAAPPPVHAAADEDEPEPTPKASPLEFEARGAAHAPAPRQGGSGLAPMVVVVGNAEAIKCPECPKWFASEKAMFGHLRKHPERGYKGATRPTAAASAAVASVQAGDKQKPKKQAVARKEAVNMTGDAAATSGEKRARDEAQHSTKWPATPKLGWAAVQAGSSCSEDEEAAMILLEMASSSRSSSETQQQQSVQPAVRAPDAVSGHDQMPPDVEQPMLLDHVAAVVTGHQTPEAEPIVQPAGHALELSAESQTPAVSKQLTNLEITTEAVLIVVPVKANKPMIFPAAGPASVVPVATKAKKLRVQNLEQTAAASPAPPAEGADAGTPPVRRIPSPASDKKFECPICGKLFPSHQALGGHVSSHAKTARHDGLAAAQAMKNILGHRNQSAGSVSIKDTSAKTARHDDLAVAQAMHNILGHRSQSAGSVSIKDTSAKTARHDDLAAAQAMHNILGHRSQGEGSASIKDTSPAGGAGVGAFVQERLDSQPPSAPAPAPAPQSAPPPHVCDVCLLTFSSGQALGGHKRKHWFPEKKAAKIALAAAAPRDFDLNELPQEGRGENNQP